LRSWLLHALLVLARRYYPWRSTQPVLAEVAIITIIESYRAHGLLHRTPSPDDRPSH
jgi:hypothetical protein